MFSLEARITSVKMSSSLFPFYSSTEPAEHIETISSDAMEWTVEVAAYLIDAGWRFYVQDLQGNRAYLQVVRRFGRPPYVRTQRDGTRLDNLLFLPGGTFYISPLRGLLSPSATNPFAVGFADPNLGLQRQPTRGLLTPSR